MTLLTPTCPHLSLLELSLGKIATWLFNSLQSYRSHSLIHSFFPTPSHPAPNHSVTVGAHTPCQLLGTLIWSREQRRARWIASHLLCFLCLRCTLSQHPSDTDTEGLIPVQRDRPSDKRQGGKGNPLSNRAYREACHGGPSPGHQLYYHFLLVPVLLGSIPF